MEASVANNEENQQESTTAEASTVETPAADVDVEVSVEALQAQIASLTADLEAARESVLRAQADAQNARRRAEQDVEKAHKFRLERIVNDLLWGVAKRGRAVAAVDPARGALAPMAGGVQRTWRACLDSWARHQVVVVDPQGAPFDPPLHEAVSVVPNPDVEPNPVIN